MKVTTPTEAIAATVIAHACKVAHIYVATDREMPGIAWQIEEMEKLRVSMGRHVPALLKLDNWWLALHTSQAGRQ